MARALFEPVYRQMLPFWEELSESDRDYLCNNSVALTYPAGASIYDGTECRGVIFVRSGCLRMYMMSDDGREITLSRLHAGEMCMFTASCVLRTMEFDVFVDAEETSECCIISGAAFSTVAESNANVKIFSLESAVGRFSDVMWALQQMLLKSLDKRLAIFLLDESARIGADTVPLTHEQIARYMGSARETVSRMLKYFGAEGLVEASRKGVRLLDKKRLRELAL